MEEENNFFERLLEKICNESESYSNYTEAGVALYNKISKIFKKPYNINSFEYIITSEIQKIDPITLISYIAKSIKSRGSFIKEVYFQGDNIEIPTYIDLDFRNIGDFLVYGKEDDKNKENYPKWGETIFNKLWLFACKLKKVDNTDLNYEEPPEFESVFKEIIPDKRINVEGIKGIKVSNLSCIMALCKSNVYKAINKELLEDNKSNNKFNEIINNNKTIDDLNNNCGYEMFNLIQSYLREKSLKEGSENQSMPTEPEKQPLNQILYGPPGTGKTYNTVVKAMQIMLTSLYEQLNKISQDIKLKKEDKTKEINEIFRNFYGLENKISEDIVNTIIDDKVEEKVRIKTITDNLYFEENGEKVTLSNIIASEEVKDNKENNENNENNKKITPKQYELLRNKFNKLKKQGRIEFITFHQSYGYEDFIEGIKPDVDTKCSETNKNGEVRYKIEDGIFKKISNRALFDRLKINNKNVFEFIKNKFINKYTVGKILETEIQKAKFIIDNYSLDSIGIRPIDSDNVYSITFNRLEEIFNKKSEKQNELKDTSGATSYYFSIYKMFLCLYNEFKLELERKIIKEYYGKKIELKSFEDSKPYVLIIDEINRGNISKILGELITLLEDDKRENFSVKLPYSHEEFTVPRNLYIIGTMNTADRSIALMDTALRRRFEFVEMMPKPELLRKVEIKDKDGKTNTNINLETMLNTMNDRIEALYDREHTIGHAFFMPLKENGTIQELGKIFKNKIIPLLQEYFYDDYSKIQLVLGDNQKGDGLRFIDEVKDKILDKPNGLFGQNYTKKIPTRYEIKKDVFNEIEAYKKIYG